MTASASQTALASALRSVAHRYRDTDAIDPFPEAETWAARLLAAMPAGSGWTSVLERQLAREQAEVERLRAALDSIISALEGRTAETFYETDADNCNRVCLMAKAALAAR